MMSDRFQVKRDGNVWFIFDTKTEEFYHRILTDKATLHEICRMLNALHKKNEIMAERVDQQCDLIKKLKKELKKYEE